MKSKYNYSVAMKRYGSVLKDVKMVKEAKMGNIHDGRPEAYFLAVLSEGLTDYYHPKFYRSSPGEDRLLAARDRYLQYNLFVDRFNCKGWEVRILDKLLLRVSRLLGLTTQSFGSSKRRLVIVDNTLKTKELTKRGHHPYYPADMTVNVTKLNFRNIVIKVLRDINNIRESYDLEPITHLMIKDETDAFFKQLSNGNFLQAMFRTFSISPREDDLSWL